MFRRVLLSVSDKTGLAGLVQGLVALQPDVEILSTGGTARAVRETGVGVTEISDWTGFPEAFGGRVKTLHPKVHGGILHHREREAEEAARLGIAPIDLVAVNLYPFADTLAACAAEDDLVEQIDIGGVALLRAAAKASDRVVVLCRPRDYGPLLEEAARGRVSAETRRALRARAFAHTAAYDALIAAALSDDAFPETIVLPLVRRQRLRYGENPHQEAALYALPTHRGGLAEFRQVHGKELSYTNVLDLAAAWNAARAVGGCAVVKHAGPCGLASAGTPRAAFEAAWAGDPVSAFGSVVALAHPADAEVARALLDGRFVEVLAAPGFTADALESLSTRKNLRLIELPAEEARPIPAAFLHALAAGDGLALVQQPDRGPDEEMGSVTRAPFPGDAEALARFAMAAARCVKSNAIVVARALEEGGFATVGIGGGQPSRVDAVKIALERARGQDLTRCVLASDAFFPFPDGVELAAAAGIRLLVQPGGSVRDAEVIEACDRLGVAMAFTGRRHFLH